MMIRKFRAVAAVVGVAFAGMACSTAYTPKRTDRLYLVVQTSRLALSKNGQVVAEDGPFSMLAQCDGAAKAAAAHAESELKDGRSLATVAAVLNVLLGPGNLIAIPLLVMAADDTNQGMASMVDTINRHNDAETCVAAEPALTAAR